MARDLRAAGAIVPCFLATTEASRDLAAKELAAPDGSQPRGFLDLPRMLDEVSLDALAILSPPETHAPLLEAACRAGLPVLCEKPFVWDVPDPVARTREILAGFAERDLAVWENCQWPYTLPGFATLHPDAFSRHIEHFRMELEPMTHGAQSLVDSLSHPLSLLQARVPGEEAAVEEIHYSTPDPGAGALTLRFHYRTEVRTVEVEVALRQNLEPPRHAAYAWNGRRATRVVSPESYRLSFHDSDRAVPIADPLTLLVADFVASLADPGGHPPPPPWRIQQRMQLLADLTAAYASQEVL